VIMCPQIIRPNHQVIDYFGAKKTDKRKMRKMEYLRRMQTEQYMVAVTEKMIWAGVLCDVNMSIAHKIFHAVLKFMEVEGVKVNDPRNYTRLINTARTLTILRAIEIVFHLKTSKYFEKPFSLYTFSALEPHLIATEEIAYFTLSLMQDMYVNPYECHVIEALCKSAKYPDNEGAWENGARESVTFRTTDQGHQDYNYIVLEGSLWDAATAAAANMDKGHKSSKENIQAILHSMTDRRILGTVRNGAGQIGLTDEKDEFTLIVCNKAKKETYVSVEWIERLRDKNHSFSVKKCIKQTFHRFSVPRRIVLGETCIRHHCPHVFQTTCVVPSADVYMKLDNIDWTGGDDTQPVYVVDCDLETIEIEKHIDSLYQKPNVYDQSVFPAVLNDSYRNNNVSSYSNYPQRYINEVEKRHLIGKKIATNQIDQDDLAQYSYGKTRKRPFSSLL
jgi:hypothetical protein